MMWKTFLLYLYLYLMVQFVVLELLVDDTNPVVETSSGPVRGKQLTTIFLNRTFYSFKGIPYAQPPSYNLRFLPPVPISPWTEPRECFDFGNVCLQFNPMNKTELIGDEDCLFLNIYTPEMNPTSLKTVMVYIHGGGWFFGSGNDDLQGPDLLINKDVILVTMNYRIGVLGFMSLGTPAYSGNQGLKDQQLALRWINENIAKFGGDRHKITIFGQSAGSSSCQFHMLSPGSKGLFQQTLQISSTFDVWEVLEKGQHLEEMYWLAGNENAVITNYEHLVVFLKSLDGSVFTTRFPIVQYYPQAVPITIQSRWLPVVENSRAIQPFMQATPNEIMLSGNFTTDVNVMAGFTTAESLFFVAPNANHPPYLNAFNYDFAIELPSMHFNKKYNSPAYRKAAAEIRKFYFPAGAAVNSNWHTIQSFVQMVSDIFENFQIDQRVKILVERSTGKTFYYRFGLVSQFNFYKILLNAQSQYGASHADDLCYVFKCNYTPWMYSNVTLESPQYKLLELMTGLYTDFAKVGHPLPSNKISWSPVSPGHIHYADITMSGINSGLNPLETQMTFWNSLLERYPELLTNDVNKCLDSVSRLKRKCQNRNAFRAGGL